MLHLMLTVLKRDLTSWSDAPVRGALNCIISNDQQRAAAVVTKAVEVDTYIVFFFRTVSEFICKI